MRIAAVLAAALVAVAVGLAVVLVESKPRQAGSNYVPEAGPIATIDGSGRHCQTGQVVPGDTGAVRILLGTFERPSPAIAISVDAGGREISSGRLKAGQPDGYVTVGIDTVDRLHADATVCVELDTQPGRRTVLYGSGDQMRLEWLRPGKESWLELLPTVAHRFGLAKPFVSGSWALALAGVLLLVAWGIALRLTLRELQA